MAARRGLDLTLLLRCYAAGASVVDDFVMQEACRTPEASVPVLQRLRQRQSSAFERLLWIVHEEFSRESAVMPRTARARKAAQIHRLLRGDDHDASGLEYDVSGFHLGLIIVSPDPTEVLTPITSTIGVRCLTLTLDDTVTWSWLGSRHPVTATAVEGCVERLQSKTFAALAIGEAGRGLTGWRNTHRQAAAVLPIALHLPLGIARYSDHLVLGSALQDDLLVGSLRKIFLDPLSQGRDGGRTLKETLRAVITSDGNVSSAASMLGVKRHTVTQRMRNAEDMIGRAFRPMSPGLQLALLLDQLDEPTGTARSTQVGSNCDRRGNTEKT